MRRRVKLPWTALVWPVKLLGAGGLAWWLGPEAMRLEAMLFAVLLVRSASGFDGLQAISRLFLIATSAIVAVSVRALLGPGPLALLVCAPVLVALLRHFRVARLAPLALLTAWWMCSHPPVGEAAQQAALVVALGLGSALAADGLLAAVLAPWAAGAGAARRRGIARDLATIGEDVASAVRQPDVRALRAADKRLAAVADALREERSGEALALRQLSEQLAALGHTAIELRTLRLPTGTLPEGQEPPAAALSAVLTAWARALRGVFDGRKPRETGLAEVATGLDGLGRHVEQPALCELAAGLRALAFGLAAVAARRIEPPAPKTESDDG